MLLIYMKVTLSKESCQESVIIQHLIMCLITTQAYLY